MRAVNRLRSARLLADYPANML